MARIPHPWQDDPLEFLVRVKFPMERAYKAASINVTLTPFDKQNQEYLRNANSYRSQLKGMERHALLAMAEEAEKERMREAAARSEAEEAQRWFNAPRASADVAYWSRMSLWTLEEATALSFGKDPRHVNWEKLKSLLQVSPFVATYQAQLELFNRARLAGQLWEKTIPAVFLAWAERMRVEMPPALVEAVQGLGVQIADWKTAYESQRARIAELEQLLAEKNSTPSPPEAPKKAQEKGLGTRERNSLLTLVIGMAAAWYGYDATKSRNSTAKEISDELQRVGLSLSDDTIRAYLNEARDLLPPPETEQKR